MRTARSPRARSAELASDSRKVRPGDVFFALAGAKDDGLRHAGDALARRRGGHRRASARRRSPAPPFVQVADARAALARAAARFFPRQPETDRRRHRHQRQDLGRRLRAADLAVARPGGRPRSARIGVVSRPLTVYGSLTTPDPIALHQTLDRLARAGVTHLALEASSHGLDQKRLDGVRLAAGAFTNLTRDHMDYHATTEDYFAAKLRLFRELLPDGAPAVIDADSAIAPRVIDAARARGLAVFTVGAKGEAIRLASARARRLRLDARPRVRRPPTPR